LAKILRGVTQLNFDKKAKLDFDRKMYVYVLKKKNKKKHFTEHSTAANPPPKAHARKAKRRRVCGSANVSCN
jgi:hypothetical protein